MFAACEPYPSTGGICRLGTLVQGTLTLFGAGLVNRVLGFFYRIVLAQRLGSQGMGLLGFAFPVLHVAITAATAGLPVAVSKVVAERAALDPRGVRAVLRTALRFVLLTSVGITALLLFSLRTVSRYLLADPRAIYPLIALVPMLTIVAVSSVLRGYFQGLQRMTPSAIGAVIEQVVRIVTALWLIDKFLPRGIEWGAAAAAAGMVIGEMCGMLVLAVTFFIRPGPAPSAAAYAAASSRGVLRELLAMALPISFTRIIGSITEFLDAAIIPRRLEAGGLSRDAATAFFGNLTGMALPLLFFPTVITFALTSALVPAVSDAFARKNLALVRMRTGQAIYLALVVSLPASVVFALYGHTLGILFYGQRQVGDLMVPLALAAPFVYLEASVSAVLRGLGLASLSMWNGLVGSGVRLLIVYTLTALPGIGMRAVILGISVDFAISFALNYRSLARAIGYTANLRRLLGPPALAATGLAAGLFILRSGTLSLGASLWLSTLAAIGIGALIYLAILLASGGGWRQFTHP